MKGYPSMNSTRNRSAVGRQTGLRKPNTEKEIHEKLQIKTNCNII